MATEERWATLLDGSGVRVSAAFEIAEPFSSFAHLVGFGEIRQISFGPVEFARWAAEGHGITIFPEQYSIHGGKLSIGSAMVSGEHLGSYRQWVAVWEGNGFSVKTSQVDGDGDLLLSLFQVISLEEVEHGVVLGLPNDDSVSLSTSDTLVTSMAVNIVDLGIIEAFPMTEDFRRRLPDYPGQEVEGGELYYDGSEDPESGRTLFVLANDSSYSVIYPRTSLEVVLAKLQTLRIDHYPPMSNTSARFEQFSNHKV